MAFEHSFCGCVRVKKLCVDCVPYKNRADHNVKQNIYRQRRKERMEQNFKLFSSIVKAHFLSGAEPSDVASEVFDDHSHLLADGFCTTR